MDCSAILKEKNELTIHVTMSNKKGDLHHVMSDGEIYEIFVGKIDKRTNFILRTIASDSFTRQRESFRNELKKFLKKSGIWSIDKHNVKITSTINYLDKVPLLQDIKLEMIPAN